MKKPAVPPPETAEAVHIAYNTIRRVRGYLAYFQKNQCQADHVSNHTVWSNMVEENTTEWNTFTLFGTPLKMLARHTHLTKMLRMNTGV